MLLLEYLYRTNLAKNIDEKIKADVKEFMDYEIFFTLVKICKILSTHLTVF